MRIPTTNQTPTFFSTQPRPLAQTFTLPSSAQNMPMQPQVRFGSWTTIAQKFGLVAKAKANEKADALVDANIIPVLTIEIQKLGDRKKEIEEIRNTVVGQLMQAQDKLKELEAAYNDKKSKALKAKEFFDKQDEAGKAKFKQATADKIREMNEAKAAYEKQLEEIQVLQQNAAAAEAEEAVRIKNLNETKKKFQQAQQQARDTEGMEKMKAMQEKINALTTDDVVSGTVAQALQRSNERYFKAKAALTEGAGETEKLLAAAELDKAMEANEADDLLAQMEQEQVATTSAGSQAAKATTSSPGGGDPVLDNIQK
jgi:hypothetical protein